MAALTDDVFQPRIPYQASVPLSGPRILIRAALPALAPIYSRAEQSACNAPAECLGVVS